MTDVGETTGQHGAVGTAAAAEGRDGRPSRPFLALVGVVIAAAVAVRIARLGTQSYWIDEVFSVRTSSGSLRSLSAASATEIHPPLYAVLLWLWTHLGGTDAAWTRLLSTLCAVVAIPVTQRGLRGVGLGEHLRWTAAAATAAGGFSLVYSLESRSYALLLLGSVGLTAATLRAVVETERTGGVAPRKRLSWCGWSLLAATTHLFGAALTLGALVVLAVVTVRSTAGGRGRALATWAGLAATGCSLQVAWLLAGLARPGFPVGTQWIRPPGGQDVWDLLTTTLAAGGLTPHSDGFAWTSPVGVVAAAGLCVAAAVEAWAVDGSGVEGSGVEGSGARARRRGAGRSRTEGTDADARAAAVLLSLAALVIATVFGLSQCVHLWTLRNMIVVTPAVLWGIICLAAALAGTTAGRRRICVAAVALLGIGLVPIALATAQPYKTDARGLVAYLVGVRVGRPDTSFVFLGSVPPGTWRTAVERPELVRAWDELSEHALTFPSAAAPAIDFPRLNAPLVVTVYHGVADPHPSGTGAVLVARLAPRSCRVVPVYGFAVVRCD